MENEWKEGDITDAVGLLRLLQDLGDTAMDRQDANPDVQTICINVDAIVELPPNDDEGMDKRRDVRYRFSVENVGAFDWKAVVSFAPTVLLWQKIKKFKYQVVFS